MKFFVSATSVATSRFANITQSVKIKHFEDLPFKEGEIIPDSLIQDFERSDVVIINGTWGNDLRKELYLEKDDTGKYILNSPKYRDNDGYIHYQIGSAIIDVINTEIRNKAIELEKPIVVFESSTISRAEQNYNDSHNIKSKFRIGLGSWIYKEAKWLEPKDFNMMRKIKAPRLYNHTWQMNDEGSIYILTGLETDPTSTMPIYDFIFKSIETIRKHTDKRIVVKIHPGSTFLEKYFEFENIFQNVFVMRENVPLKDLYRDMYCAVIDNSTSIFELIDAGIPTYCSGVNFGEGLNNIDLNTINNIHLASKNEVEEWTECMCCTELDMSILNDENEIKKLITVLAQKEIK
jgi:hypothetical protein